MLRFLTSGESHGPMLVAILDGMPAGVELDVKRVNEELHRRQQGYGRGARQKIEKDTAEFTGGLRHGITSGAPLSIVVRNRDWENWQQVMSVEPIDLNLPGVREQLQKKRIERFRPGHADLAGALKFRQRDIRDVLERASARETAARVAIGAVCQQLLTSLGISMVSHVVQVGDVRSQLDSAALPLAALEQQVLVSEMFCGDGQASERMKEVVRSAWQEGDSLGGVVEVLCDGLPVGLGSYTQWDKKIDGLLAQAILSVQAIKAVEIGDGVSSSSRPGSQVHDALYPLTNSANGNFAKADENADNSLLGNAGTIGLPFYRQTNRAGGIEGGMTNGSRLLVRAYMKPIPTLRKGLPSLSFPLYQPETAHYERSDVCAVPAASVVVKAMVAFVLTRAILNKFGGDTIYDTKAALEHYRAFCRQPWSRECVQDDYVGLADTGTGAESSEEATLPEMELE